MCVERFVGRDVERCVDKPCPQTYSIHLVEPNVIVVYILNVYRDQMPAGNGFSV